MVEPSLVLAIMLKLEPSSPFRDTFESTATAIATVSESPLPGLDETKTASVLIAVTWFESRFQQDAAGDCDKTTKLGTCAEGSRPHSFCAGQISETNFRELGVTKSELLSDIGVCLRTTLRMLRRSFQVCASHKLEERLAHYAGGGNQCAVSPDAIRKSRHRMNLAGRIFGWLTP